MKKVNIILLIISIILIVLGIIIGIGSVIAIVTVGDSLILSVSENMQSMGANDVYIMVEPKKQMDEISKKIDGARFGQYTSSNIVKEDDCLSSDMIKEMCEKFSDEIYAINLQYYLESGKVPKGNQSVNVNPLGVSAGYFVTNDLTMLSEFYNIIYNVSFDDYKILVI